MLASPPSRSLRGPILKSGLARTPRRRSSSERPGSTRGAPAPPPHGPRASPPRPTYLEDPRRGREDQTLDPGTKGRSQHRGVPAQKAPSPRGPCAAQPPLPQSALASRHRSTSPATNRVPPRGAAQARRPPPRPCPTAATPPREPGGVRSAVWGQVLLSPSCTQILTSPHLCSRLNLGEGDKANTTWTHCARDPRGEASGYSRDHCPRTERGAWNLEGEDVQGDGAGRSGGGSWSACGPRIGTCAAGLPAAR